MEKIYILCPSDWEGYLHLRNDVGPRLDDTGISFHICRPGEDIAGSVILHGEEVKL